jgi:hypothetical protein
MRGVSGSPQRRPEQKVRGGFCDTGSHTMARKSNAEQCISTVQKTMMGQRTVAPARFKIPAAVKHTIEI